MKSVHSLVRDELNGVWGWRAPVELESDSPKGVSYVIPTENGVAFDAYACEVIKVEGLGKRSVFQRTLERVGDAFVLNLDDREFWFDFVTRDGQEHCLPYIGELSHADFQFCLAEIEPHDYNAMEQLCRDTGIFVGGCNPFKHYGGLSREMLTRGSALTP